MEAKPPYRISGAVIARRGDKFLLVRKDRVRHAWQFPQGGTEKNEAPRQAAAREFAEEIGTAAIEIVGEEREIHRYDFPPNAEFPPHVTEKWNFRGQEVHIFLADFVGEDSEIKLQEDELAEWRWVSIEELDELLEDEKYLELVKKIIRDGQN